MRLKSLARSGLTPRSGRSASTPSLIIGLVTGYGLRGPDKASRGLRRRPHSRQRSGVLHQMRAWIRASPGRFRWAFGDHVVGLATVAGVLGATDRAAHGTGRGSDRRDEPVANRNIHSRLGIGDSNCCSAVFPEGVDRSHSKTPLVNCYRSKDDHWFWLLGVEADRHFPSLIWAIDRDDLPNDPPLCNRTRSTP